MRDFVRAEGAGGRPGGAGTQAGLLRRTSWLHQKAAATPPLQVDTFEKRTVEHSACAHGF